MKTPVHDCVRALALLAICTGPAIGQCSEWSDGFDLSGVNGTAWSVVRFDDGSGPAWIVAGIFTTPLDLEIHRLVRWNGEGWSELATLDGDVTALTTFDDGTGTALYVGGRFTTIGGVAAQHIAKWDGHVWSAVGGGLTEGSAYFGTQVRAFAAFDDGSGPALYAAGSFKYAGGVEVHHIARWNGSAWSAVGGGVSAPNVPEAYTFVYALETFDDGAGTSLFVGGDFTRAGTVTVDNVARWNGTAWSALSSGLSTSNGPDGATVSALAVFDDGSGSALYCGGSFETAGGSPALSIARWNGSSFSGIGDVITVNASGTHPGNVQALRVHDDGSGSALYVGGLFTRADGVDTRALARWNGTTWSALPANLEPYGATELPSVRSLVVDSDSLGSSLLVAGYFERAGGRARPGIARWRNGAYEPFGGEERGLRGEALAFERFDDGGGARLYVGGKFTYVNGAPCKHLARWDGNALSPWATVDGLGDQTSVNAFALWNDGTGSALYVGGAFTSVDGVPANGIARWDGNHWSSLGAGVTGEGTGLLPAQVAAIATFDDGSEPALFAAGRFGNAGGVPAQHIAKWNGTAWSSVGGGAPGVPLGTMAISALAVYDDGTGAELYAGGKIIAIGGIQSFYLARWNGSHWSSVGSGIGGNYNSSEVKSLVVADVGSGEALYVGGKFDAAGGHLANRVAAWNGTWSAISGTLAPGTASVRALAAFDDGSGGGPALYAATEFFDPFGGSAVEVLARHDGASWTSLDVGIFSPASPVDSIRASALRVYDDGTGSGADLYVGGSFLRAGSRPSCGIARLPGCGETGELFCFGDGSATACPCANNSPVGDRAGCSSSLGFGGALRARGETSLSADSSQLVGSAMTNAAALYVQGMSRANGGLGVTFGDGVKCVAGPFVRLGTKVNSAGASVYPAIGDPRLSLRGMITTPGTRHYQVRYRNAAAFCTPDGFNYTNALSLIWRP